ncbi:hypothetical protein D3C78_1719010 [compost metagenome]
MYLGKAWFQALEHETGQEWTQTVFDHPQGQCFAHGQAWQLSRGPRRPVPAVGGALVIAVEWKQLRQLDLVAFDGALADLEASLAQSFDQHLCGHARWARRQ